MNHLYRYLFFSLIILLSTFAGVYAQEVFDDPEGKYTLTLPPGWLAIVNQDSRGGADINIVFRVRENGALKLRRVDDYDPNKEIMDFAKEDENQTVRFRPAYNKLSLEKFLAGNDKTGALLSYDYKNAADQPFTGRVYYLKLNEKTIYVLTFTGRKNILGTLRNQTDSIARSFKLKE
jgi:hypothetical protein